MEPWGTPCLTQKRGHGSERQRGVQVNIWGDLRAPQRSSSIAAPNEVMPLSRNTFGSYGWFYCRCCAAWKESCFPLLAAAREGYLHLDHLSASFIFFKRVNVTVCHVSAILTPVGTGSTIMIDDSAQVSSHGNGHQGSTLEDQLAFSDFAGLASIPSIIWWFIMIFDVHRVLPSHFNTSYFYGLSGSCWGLARLFDPGARYLLLWGSYGIQTFASTSCWIQQNGATRR